MSVTSLYSQRYVALLLMPFAPHPVRSSRPSHPLTSMALALRSVSHAFKPVGTVKAEGYISVEAPEERRDEER